MSEKKRAQWAIDAEEAGLDWDKLSLFDKIQWQKKYPRGRLLLASPVIIRAYGRERFDSSRFLKANVEAMSRADLIDEVYMKKAK